MLISGRTSTKIGSVNATMFSLKLVVAVTLSVGGAEGWFMEQDKGRELDGSLRCYQCDTNSKLPEDKSSAALCRSKSNHIDNTNRSRLIH